MSQRLSSGNIRRLDLFKTIVLIGLIGLLLLLMLRGFQSPMQIGAFPTSAPAGAPTLAMVTEIRATQVATAQSAVAAPRVTEPLANAQLDSSATTIRGSGQPGGQVQIMVDDKVVAQVKVGSDGTWTYPLNLGRPGDYRIKVQSIDASGQVLATSNDLPITVAAAAPVLVSPTSTDKLASGKTALKGTGTPNSEVEIVLDGQAMGKANVAADGTWTFDVDLSQPGAHRLALRSLDAGGKPASQLAEVSLTVAAAAPAISAPTLKSPSGTDRLPAGEVMFSGTGAPGTEVEIVVDGKAVGTAKISTDGTWTLAAQIDGAGTRAVQVRALDASGQSVAESAPVSLSFEAATVAPKITSPAMNANLSGGEVPLTGTGTPGNEIEILDGGKVVGKVKVGADGTWRFSFKPAAGVHELAARESGEQASSQDSVKVTVAAPPLLPASGAPCVGLRGRVQGDTYVVGACDTVIGISRRLKVDWHALLAANPQITNPNRIYIGQVLALPR